MPGFFYFNCLRRQHPFLRHLFVVDPQHEKIGYRFHWRSNPEFVLLPNCSSPENSHEYNFAIFVFHAFRRGFDYLCAFDASDLPANRTNFLKISERKFPWFSSDTIRQRCRHAVIGASTGSFRKAEDDPIPNEPSKRPDPFDGLLSVPNRCFFEFAQNSLSQRLGRFCVIANAVIICNRYANNLRIRNV